MLSKIPSSYRIPERDDSPPCLKRREGACHESRSMTFTRCGVNGKSSNEEIVPFWCGTIAPTIGALAWTLAGDLEIVAT
ncbi:hypothetical protein LX36DRAFT_659774 [Colletotrichum falcatum]|nr:hypothetical protein LX36DRAFT_659774 [Colletotrichum falcatum]